MRRRLALASTALLTVGVALATSGSGAMGITAGVFGAQPNAVDFGNVAASAPQTITETLTNNGAGLKRKRDCGKRHCAASRQLMKN